MTMDRPTGCEGTAIEHPDGDWECTITGCTAALELHTLTIRCHEVRCRCTRSDESGRRVRA